jgi:hypothetical protein
MVLTDGRPTAPRTLDEIGDVAGPEDFWRALFHEVANVDVRPSTTVQDREIGGNVRIFSGNSGAADVGYRWTVKTPLESSMFSAVAIEETYGLPGIEASWSGATTSSTLGKQVAPVFATESFASGSRANEIAKRSLQSGSACLVARPCSPLSAG